jgi:hypothetical protein
LTAAFLCRKIYSRLIVPHDGFMENLHPLFGDAKLFGAAEGVSGNGEIANAKKSFC